MQVDKATEKAVTKFIKVKKNVQEDVIVYKDVTREVEKPVYKNKKVDVDRIVEKPVEKIVKQDKERIVEKIKYVDNPIENTKYVDRIIEKPVVTTETKVVTVTKNRIVPKVVKKKVQVERVVEKAVEQIVYVEKPVIKEKVVKV